MKHHKPIVRRTFSQERFEILIKKQKKGNATFTELTELDEIVNRDPSIRYIVLEEMDTAYDQTGGDKNENTTLPPAEKQYSLGEKILAIIKSFYLLYNKKIPAACATRIILI